MLYTSYYLNIYLNTFDDFFKTFAKLVNALSSYKHAFNARYPGNMKKKYLLQKLLINKFSLNYTLKDI